MTPKIDTYIFYARLIPSLLTSLPLLLLLYVLGEIPAAKQFINQLSIKVFGATTFYFVFLYFYSHVVRATSKYFENKYFINDRGFPSTYFMSFSDSKYSKEYKIKFREKVKRVLQWELLEEAQELDAPSEAKKRLDEAVKLIIPVVGKGQLVQEYNTWYGFFRNLIGGLIYAMAFCVINLLLSRFFLDSLLLTVGSIFLLSIYIAIFSFRRIILKQYAETYADKLFAEFMTLATPKS